jgi:hypothetical protein
MGIILLAAMIAALCWRNTHPPVPVSPGGFTYRLGLAEPKESPMPLSLTITNEQKIKITVTPTTASGKPAQLDGPIRVSTVSGESTAVAVDGEPNSAYLVSADTPGATTFLVEGDADLGAGVQLEQDTAELNVAGALAANLGLTAGTAEPK